MKDVTPLPDEFPAKDLLAAYGFLNYEDLRGMTEDRLKELKGIGNARARAILEATRDA